MNESLVLIVSLIIGIVEGFIILIGFDWYYKHGIRIYRKKGFLPPDINFPLGEDYFNEFIPKSMFMNISISPFIDPNIYAVRENIFYFRVNYIPILRGVIRIDQKTKEFSFDWLLNLYSFLFIIDPILLSIGLSMRDMLSNIFRLYCIVFIFFMFTFIIQNNRYNKIFSNIINRL
jgi:hypothetical protein